MVVGYGAFERRLHDGEIQPVGEFGFACATVRDM